MALVGETSDGELSTILGRRGAFRRFDVSFATRMGAGLGNVNEIGLGGGGEFFLEVEAQPEKDADAAQNTEKINGKRIAFIIDALFSKKPDRLELEVSVDFILLISIAGPKT